MPDLRLPAQPEFRPLAHTCDETVFNYTVTCYFSAALPPRSVPGTDPLGERRSYAAKEAVVCRTPAPFAAEAGRGRESKAEDRGKRREGFMVKMADWCPGKLDSIPTFARELLWCWTLHRLFINWVHFIFRGPSHDPGA